MTRREEKGFATESTRLNCKAMVQREKRDGGWQGKNMEMWWERGWEFGLTWTYLAPLLE